MWALDNYTAGIETKRSVKCYIGGILVSNIIANVTADL